MPPSAPLTQDDHYATLVTVVALSTVYTVYYYVGVKATQKFNDDETKALFRIHVYQHNRRKAGEVARRRSLGEFAAPHMLLRKGSVASLTARAGALVRAVPSRAMGLVSALLPAAATATATNTVRSFKGACTVKTVAVSAKSASDHRSPVHPEG